MNLKGKVGLVTGAAKRVGRAIALGLASRGVHVAITYCTSHRDAEETVRAIRAKGVKAMAVRVDQRCREEVRDGVKEIVSRFGRVDLLINNASSFYPTPIETVTESQWEDLLSTNLTGPWAFAQALAPILKRQKAGKIINIVDAAAFSPWADYLPYCAAKGGLVTLTKGLAKALAPKVQVNAVAPGPILFPPQIGKEEKERAIRKTLLKRSGSPADIVAAILFLLESDFITGVILPVDGGRLLA